MSKTFPEILRYGEQPTLTPATKKQYVKLVWQMIKRIAKKYELEPMEIPAYALVVDLKDRDGTLKENTLRLYRAALTHWFKSEGEGEALAKLDSAVFESSGAQPEIRSKKGIKRDDWNRLFAYIQKLNQSGGQYKAGVMLVSMIFTGLRPVEWERATLVELSRASAAEYPWAKSFPGTGQITALHVFNAKNTNGRGGSGERYVPVPAEWLRVVKLNLDFIASHIASGEPYSKYQSVCQTAIGRLMKAVFPKRREHYTLYSARHQFAAEMKSRLTKTEVADLMGHGSDTTAGRHYARATQAWKGGYSSDFTQRERIPGMGFKPKSA